MTKVMRGLLLFCGIFLTSADKHIKCTLDAAEAVDEMLDAAIYTWASVERCGKPGSYVLCEVDIAHAAESINGMVNVIVKAVERCAGVKHSKCGVASGYLTKAAMGLAGASGGIIEKCPNSVNPTAGASNHLSHAGLAGKLATCVVDIKDSMGSIFKAVKRMIDAHKKDCNEDNPVACATKSLNILASLASVAEFVTASVGHCSRKPLGEPTDTNIACATEVADLVHNFDAIASASVDMAHSCNHESARLYEIEKKIDAPPAPKAAPVTMVLAALLPLTGVMSFVGGSRFAKMGGRSQRQLGVELNQEDVEGAPIE